MSASAKTGGNKKAASPSDTAYQARRKMGNRSDLNKAKRLKRHVLRMEKKAAHRKVWEAKQSKSKLFPSIGAAA